jgi:transcriptional regulator with XRE-family HTH domain
MDKDTQVMANFFKWQMTRKDNPLTVPEIAEKLEVKEQFIYNITAGRRKTPIPDHVLNKVRNVFYDEGNQYISENPPDEDHILSRTIEYNEMLVRSQIKLTDRLLLALEEIERLRKIIKGKKL